MAAAALLALLAIACAGDSAKISAEAAPPAAVTAASADEVVRQAVEFTGMAYAGDCAATQSPRDIGKVCSKLIGERDGMRAYLTGRTFSEFSTWVFVEQTSAGWQLAGTTPLDFFAVTETIPWP
ncbi:MAG: hypothetical protein HYX51_00020 [Chloroflexi bacterium]|nr:hypothetical protein [Chloroflexota bacterium]